VTPLRDLLQGARARGRKLLVPYVMGGLPSPAEFEDVLAAVSESADAVEVGLPYSDPLMDGPVIAAAGRRALEAGVGPLEALDLAGAGGARPPVVMTYYNPIHHLGESAFCARAARAGVAGLIVPDLPLEESASLRAEAEGAGIAWIPLVAPTSSPARVAALAATATGFVYAISTLGVTGVRESLSERFAAVATACREETEAPVLLGIGISSAAQAVAACEHADGVVIGSAVVRLVLDEDAASARTFLSEVRGALDGRWPSGS
jgi:tryptophan synthase alpha chain